MSPLAHPKGKTPSRSSNLRKGVLFSAYGQASLRTTSQSRRKLLASSPRGGAIGMSVRLPFVQPLSLASLDSSPSRGASGETVHFAGTAKASPTRRGGTPQA